MTTTFDQIDRARQHLEETSDALDEVDSLEGQFPGCIEGAFVTLVENGHYDKDDNVFYSLGFGDKCVALFDHMKFDEDEDGRLTMTSGEDYGTYTWDPTSGFWVV